MFSLKHKTIINVVFPIKVILPEVLVTLLNPNVMQKLDGKTIMKTREKASKQHRPLFYMNHCLKSSDKLEPNSFLQSKKIVFIYSSFLKNWNMFISQSNKAYLTSLMVVLLHLLVDNGQLEHCVSFMPK